MGDKEKKQPAKEQSAIPVIAFFIIIIVVSIAVFSFYNPSSKPTTSKSAPTEQTKKADFILEITTSEPHFGSILVEDKNNIAIYIKNFEGNDEATVTNEYKITAGVGDTFTVEVQFGGYVSIRLYKERIIFNKLIASKTDFDGIIFRYTIKEDDI